MHLGRINGVLAAGVLLLSLVLIFGPEPEGSKPEVRLTSLDPQSIQRLTIQGRHNLDFLRRDGVWYMSTPESAPADGKKIGAILRLAAAPSRRQIEPQQVNLKELGLNPSRIRVKMDQLLLEIGGTEPIHRRRYIRVGGQIHLVDDLFHHHLTAPPEVYLAPKP